ncbi:hypothetical protein AN641_09225 [Candidatus Epulonipiscioides gigas]|nr:hypothetical protein AN641_09225 [Epulopiscium sp. SCG-C07WGA-EpuloA2]
MKNNKTLLDYKEIIMSLPEKEKYTKNDLLIPELLVDKNNFIEIYYAPHNEYINKEAKIFIIGITPGFKQMNKAIITAKNGFNNNLNIETIQKNCKEQARFSGTLRKFMINMLDEIQLNRKLQIDTTARLFEPYNKLLHSVSLIPYPTFIAQQNYNGHSPKLLNNQFLMNYVREHFSKEIAQLKNKNELLIIPLGKAVELVVVEFAKYNLLNQKQILQGFPHPSGANRNRIKQLIQNKESLITQVNYSYL